MVITFSISFHLPLLLQVLKKARNGSPIHTATCWQEEELVALRGRLAEACGKDSKIISQFDIWHGAKQNAKPITAALDEKVLKAELSAMPQVRDR